jgi:hypothetical protein
MPSQGFVEVLLACIVIPWCGWVTASIFNQRQQIALLKQEVALLKKIETLLSKRGKL